MQVNAGTLHDNIERLEGFQREHIISLDGEYQLKAYKMLLDYMLHDVAEDNSGQYVQGWDTK